MLHLKTLYDFQSDKCYISKNLNNGDWNYRLAVKVLDLSDYGDDFPHKYDVSILAISPEAAGQKNVDSAISSLGMTDEDLKHYEDLPLFQYEALIQYGIFAQLWNESGNNLSVLMAAAHKELQTIELLFGFYMDRPENRIGQDGWNLIAGQDLRDYFAGLKTQD